jgi:hypothetical protein
MSGSLIPNAKQQFLDANGNPLAGGFVYYYIPSTTTFKNTYQNAALTILNSNPIILDSAGECIAYGSGTYRQIVTDVNGNLIWDQPTTSLPNDALNISYLPPFTNSVTETVSAKLSESVSVKDFGAVGNGSADDTTAIQNAINASYGNTLFFPPGNYLISSALSITAPICIQANAGSIQGSVLYGARIFTNTAGINLLNINYSGSGGNLTGGGSITGLRLDGNSNAAIGLNITGLNTTKINFYSLNIANCTNIGLYINANHSYRFFGCQFVANGITSDTVNNAGVYVYQGNCVNFFGCASEVNRGCGVIFNQGYANIWDGGTIEGNHYHGVYALNLAQQTAITNIDFEENNQLNNANIYDVYLSQNANSYFDVSNNNFALNTRIANKIYNNGSANYFSNNRAYNGYALLAGSGTGGVYIGTILNPNTSINIYGKVINSNSSGFSYTSPAVPATGVYTSFVNFDTRVYIVTSGTTTGYKLKDSGGTIQAFTATLFNGQAIDLPAGWTLAIDYSVAPTWKWASI